jgi:hypothetical protein
VWLGSPGLIIERRADGCILAESPHPLDAYPQQLRDRLKGSFEAMGSSCAERVFLAQRAPYPHDEKTWRTITYGDFRTRIRSIGIFGL